MAKSSSLYILPDPPPAELGALDYGPARYLTTDRTPPRGAAFAVRKKLVARLPFREDLGRYAHLRPSTNEMRDWYERVLFTGARVYWAPQCVVAHRAPGLLEEYLCTHQ